MTKRRIIPVHDDRGAPETQKKLRRGPDPIDVLQRTRADFRAAHADSADEIRTVVEALSKPLGLPEPCYEPAVDGGRRRDPLWLPDDLESICRRFYWPWMDRLKGERMDRVVMPVIVDRFSCREIEREYGVPRKIVADAVTLALTWYALASGRIRRAA